MPMTDEPALRRAPAWTMSASELDEACGLLGVVEATKEEEVRAVVIAAAGRYLRWRSRENATPPLVRQKAQLVKVKNAAGRLVKEVENLARNPDAEFAFLYQLQRRSGDAEISNAAGLAKPMDIDRIR